MLIFIQSIFHGKSIFLISRLRVSYHFTADMQWSMLEESINLAGQLKSRESITHKSILLCDYNVMKIQFLYMVCPHILIRCSSIILFQHYRRYSIRKEKNDRERRKYGKCKRHR